MAKSKEINMNLPSADDLFTTREERDQKNQEHVKNISVYDISDFPNHPFKVKMDDKMVETIESIREHGVLVPALVREKPTGGYEMISGHRRKMASELAGLENIPCIVRNLSDDEAVIVMVDSNLQREEILPSEKAFAYKMRLEAMKRQAGRPSKENVSPVATHFLCSVYRLAVSSLPAASCRQRLFRLAVSFLFADLRPPLQSPLHRRASHGR